MYQKLLKSVDFHLLIKNEGGHVLELRLNLRCQYSWLRDHSCLRRLQTAAE